VPFPTASYNVRGFGISFRMLMRGHGHSSGDSLNEAIAWKDAKQQSFQAPV